VALFLIRRLLQSVVALFVVSLIVFVGVYGIGNPVDILISPDATPEELRRITRVLGLDRPMWEQYGLFVLNALRGDLGNSFIHNQPAIQLILERFPATFELAISAMLIAVLLGIPLGMWAGLRPNGIAGRSIMAGALTLALVSWSARDPSLNHATSGHVRNLLGGPGAIVSDSISVTNPHLYSRLTRVSTDSVKLVPQGSTLPLRPEILSEKVGIVKPSPP